ncbi:ribonuclease III [Mediterranea massiliensis]|uniref:ribonuclease III n=1 Tax=Mediterranea massiliensis TaxID=1841865 RepID=UPI0023F3F7D9|nr:ribonuclease III [Mediterranea massiliensis]
MLRNQIDRIRLLFHKERESYFCFYRILGFFPRNLKVYQQALLHKSTSLRSEEGRPLNNERLEFLGDAILDAIVGDIVFQHFEGKREGFLTNTRSKIVQRETLNKLAVEIGLDKLVKYAARSSSHNSYMYGNAFEAFIGAIYLDQGYDRCKQFMEKKIFKHYIDLEKMSRKEVNFKSKLIEWSQKHKVEVSFELIEQFIDHENNPMFQTEVQIEGLPAGTGTGYSKKESQQNAAQMALKKIKSDDAFREHIEQLKAAHRHPADTVYADEPLPTDETAADEALGLEPSPIRIEMEATSEEILEDSILEQETDKTSSPAPEDSSYSKQTPI